MADPDLHIRAPGLWKKIFFPPFGPQFGLKIGGGGEGGGQPVYWICHCIFTNRVEAKMTPWRESTLNSPITVTRVKTPASVEAICRLSLICCWFSPLHREVLLRVLRFYHRLQNQHFQISILDLELTACVNEFIRTPKYFVGKQITIHFFHF